MLNMITYKTFNEHHFTCRGMVVCLETMSTMLEMTDVIPISRLTPHGALCMYNAHQSALRVTLTNLCIPTRATLCITTIITMNTLGNMYQTPLMPT